MRHVLEGIFPIARHFGLAPSRLLPKRLHKEREHFKRMAFVSIQAVCPAGILSPDSIGTKDNHESTLGLESVRVGVPVRRIEERPPKHSFASIRGRRIDEG